MDVMYIGCMTKEMDPVPLKGGPSDGRLFRPTTRWPMYLHPDGTKMPAGMGDRIVNGRSARKGCYVQQRPVGQGARVTHYAWREIKS